MLADHTTLTQFLIEERRRHPAAGGDLNSVVLDIAVACKAVANRVALGALRNAPSRTDGSPAAGPTCTVRCSTRSTSTRTTTSCA